MAMLQQCNRTTVKQCTGPTVQQDNCETVYWANSATVQRCNRTTVKQCTGPTVQQCNASFFITKACSQSLAWLNQCTHSLKNIILTHLVLLDQRGYKYHQPTAHSVTHIPARTDSQRTFEPLYPKTAQTGPEHFPHCHTNSAC